MKINHIRTFINPNKLSVFFIAGALLVGCTAPAVPATDTAAQGSQETVASTTTDVTMADGSKFNVNMATEEEFLTIPNVGEKMVDEFMEYRPFISIAQFRQDIGKYVDEAQLAAYEEFLFVPVDANESDSATLQQLPGVDEAMAEQIIAGRPYASEEAFLEALSGLVSADDATASAQYLGSGEAMAEAMEVADHTKLNVNTATEEEFLTIPNVGEKMADEFMEYRPFVSIAQFRQDIGKYVDETQLAEYEEYLFIPVDPNASDAATLQQLPDIDAAAAETLIAGRPYASNDEFLKILADYMSEHELAEASSLLGAE